MGVGKTTVCRHLQKMLNRSVFLDGDWCWDAHPFQVTEETKAMVLENICFLLNQFLRCSAYEHVIFCWVLHEQEILDAILDRLETACEIRAVSLLCTEAELTKRLEQDIGAGRRTPDIILRSAARIPCYGALRTIKLATDHKTPPEIAQDILSL